MTNKKKELKFRIGIERLRSSNLVHETDSHDEVFVILHSPLKENVRFYHQLLFDLVCTVHRIAMCI